MVGGELAQWRRKGGSMEKERWLNERGVVAQWNRRGGSTVAHLTANQ
jgi:hypothetical protein